MCLSFIIEVLRNMGYEKKFKKVVLGGSFDHLHKGHKEFLKFAGSISQRIILGITSDEYIKQVSGIKYYVSSIEPYIKRRGEVLGFLKLEGLLDRLKIIKIDDVYGPTLDPRQDLYAILVTEKTLPGAAAINRERKKLGLRKLEVIIAPEVLAEDGKPISSGRIRKGEISRDGKLYIKPEWLKQKLFLSESLRNELRKPLGVLIDKNYEKPESEFVVTVGDITTQMFNKMSAEQEISVIDFKVSRKEKFSKIEDLGFLGNEEIINAENPAGQITPSLFKAIKQAFLRRGRTIVKVLGEEDLAVLPAILAAPLSSVIFYGQPNEGLVKVEITEETKEKVYNLVLNFNTRGY